METNVHEEEVFVEMRKQKGLSSVSKWNIMGHTFPRAEIVFLSQMFLILIVVISGIYNLTCVNKNDPLWIALISSCLGYILPAPTIKNLPNKQTSRT